MSIHSSEWLGQAKKVPVGQKRRVYHGGEETKAMDVYNNPESWSAYCHRCHEGARIYKELLEKPDESAPQYRKYLDQSKLLKLSAVDTHIRARIVKLLHDKGMSTVTIAALKPWYNPVDERLVFRFYGVDIGRDTTGRSGAKWLVYHRDVQRGYVYLQGENSYQTREPVILCEDLFSAQKIRYYTGWSTLVLMGTNFKEEIAHFLLDKFVVIATDGDKAGWKSMRSILTRCSLFGIEAVSVDVPDGLDPKDMQPNHLINMFKFLEN